LLIDSHKKCAVVEPYSTTKTYLWHCCGKVDGAAARITQ